MFIALVLAVVAAFTPSLNTEVLYLGYGYDRHEDGVFQGSVEKGIKSLQYKS